MLTNLSCPACLNAIRNFSAFDAIHQDPSIVMASRLASDPGHIGGCDTSLKDSRKAFDVTRSISLAMSEIGLGNKAYNIPLLIW